MMVYVFGAGGHARVVVSTLLEAGRAVAGLFDDDARTRGQQVLGVEVLGPIREAVGLPGGVGVLAIGDNRTRRKVAETLRGWTWLPVVHPRASVHDSVELGPGTVVFAGAVIQPEARLGSHCIVNTGATVDHECEIGSYAHLAPGVHLGGGVKVGEGVLLGIGAVAIPGVRIGAWSVVGAGSVVLEDLSAGVKAVGAPARAIGVADALKSTERENDG